MCKVLSPELVHRENTVVLAFNNNTHPTKCQSQQTHCWVKQLYKEQAEKKKTALSTFSVSYTVIF